PFSIPASEVAGYGRGVVDLHPVERVTPAELHRPSEGDRAVLHGHGGSKQPDVHQAVQQPGSELPAVARLLRRQLLPAGPVVLLQQHAHPALGIRGGAVLVLANPYILSIIEPVVPQVTLEPDIGYQVPSGHGVHARSVLIVWIA